MIELNERLSEFSYGYGVTKQIENLLNGVGIKTTPFLPSLLHEAKLGFDVAFDKPGTAILVQFKLGQSLRRFVRTKTTTIVPSVARPYWRFTINTAEHEGQYETLVKAESDGAETYYAAPRFVDWQEYLTFFEADSVLENSLLIRPSEIRNKLTSQGLSDGPHKIIYDGASVFVCSEPIEVYETRADQLASRVIQKISDQPLEQLISHIFTGLEHRYQVRREKPTTSHVELEPDSEFTINEQAAVSRTLARKRRLSELTARARSSADALGAAMGVEMWSLGIQVIFATKG